MMAGNSKAKTCPGEETDDGESFKNGSAPSPLGLHPKARGSARSTSHADVIPLCERTRASLENVCTSVQLPKETGQTSKATCATTPTFPRARPHLAGACALVRRRSSALPGASSRGACRSMCPQLNRVDESAYTLRLAFSEAGGGHSGHSHSDFRVCHESVCGCGFEVRRIAIRFASISRRFQIPPPYGN
jgi:hypothetical protein